MCTHTYSLIIPHFNIPNLLRRLLRTVPIRDDLQVIVVDDCSTKNIAELELVKDEFPWVEWYSTETNSGAGSARNIGLKKAFGKYVFFADSDDFFLPSIYDLLDKYRDSHADIIYLNAGSCDTESYESINRNRFLKLYHDMYQKNPEAAIFKLRFTFGEPWCKIVKRELIITNNIYFQELPCHNDTYFSYMTGFFAKKILVDSRLAYVVTHRKDSIIHTNIENRIDIFFKVFTTKEQFFLAHQIEEHAYDTFDYIITNLFRMKFSFVRLGYSYLCKNLPKNYINRVLLKRILKRIWFMLNMRKPLRILN